MALNDVKFNRSQGGLGRPLPGNDHISGMLFYTAGSLPSGFASDDRIKKIFSIKEAENLGILDDHADETLATGGQVTVTGTWIIGEIVRIELDGASIGQFVLTATTITLLVAGLVAAINAGTTTGIKHGWVATDADPIITLVQPAKLGLKNDSGTPLVFIDRNAGDTAGSAGGTSTDVQMSGGVASYFAIMHYHINAYFVQQPQGVLYVSINAQNTYNGDEIQTIQNFSLGEIRQLAIYISHETHTAAQLTVSQADLNTLETENRPMSVVQQADMSSTTVAALATLGTLSNERVTASIGEEGDYHQLVYVNTKDYKAGDKVIHQGGAFIAKSNVTAPTGLLIGAERAGPYDSTKWTFLRENLALIAGFSIGVTGTLLGAVSFAKVHENVAWVEKFNVADGALDSVGFATTELFVDQTVALLDTLDNFSYVFLRKHTEGAGTYFNDSWTAITQTDDFATIENVRTMDKAVRNIRTNMLPNVASPLYVNTDGTLSEDTIAKFKNDAERATLQMVAEGELSQQQVVIDPTQDVLSTSKIVIAVTLVPVGVGRDIQIDIGFDVKIAS